MDKIEATIDLTEALDSLIRLFMQSNDYQGTPIDRSDLIYKMVEILKEDLLFRD
jgi:hypothetical protein